LKILGLTGPSGAGKGAVCNIFKAFGIPSIDTDAVYHQLLEEGGSIKNELCTAFGPDILDESGKIDRKKLASAVFGKENTPSLLHTLNTITHKYVMARTHDLMQAIKQSGAIAVLIDAPLLFEAGIEKECDAVIGVLADRKTRLCRITERDSITEEAAQMRIDAQKSDAFYRKSCQYILENNNDYETLETQICRLIKELGLEV
jgi:dephospho-CoA kinase